MFHMLGRFAFTSSLSRRSSSGLSMGTTRFGSCFCETVLLSIFIISHQSIHYSQLKLPPRLLPRPSQHPEPNRSLVMFRITHMGRCLPNHTLWERGGACRLLRIRHVARLSARGASFRKFHGGLKG